MSHCVMYKENSTEGKPVVCQGVECSMKRIKLKEITQHEKAGWVHTFKEPEGEPNIDDIGAKFHLNPETLKKDELIHLGEYLGVEIDKRAKRETLIELIKDHIDSLSSAGE